MNDIPNRPDYCTEDMLIYLDRLRNSGITNMFGASPYLVKGFGLALAEAKAVLLYWMNTYSERHSKVTEL